MMIAEGNADRKWSDKKMKNEDDLLQTVECLRARLIAERTASRKAKEDAEHMGNKLIELEIKLREETRSRNKAEKKLNYLIKKLESMNISFSISEESDHSSLLAKSEISSVTFTDASSIRISEDKGHNSQFQESNGSSKSSLQEEGKNGEDEKHQKEESVNSSLALVPIDFSKPKETIRTSVLDATVREVLDALRHAKEKLQTQMEKQHMIKVGHVVL